MRSLSCSRNKLQDFAMIIEFELLVLQFTTGSGNTTKSDQTWSSVDRALPGVLQLRDGAAIQEPAPRVQVLNNHMLTQHLYYNYFCQNPKYLIIDYLDPYGSGSSAFGQA